MQPPAQGYLEPPELVQEMEMTGGFQLCAERPGAGRREA